MCKHYAILFKGLERQQILVSVGVLESIPMDTDGNCISSDS